MAVKLGCNVSHTYTISFLVISAGHSTIGIVPQLAHNSSRLCGVLATPCRNSHAVAVIDRESGLRAFECLTSHPDLSNKPFQTPPAAHCSTTTPSQFFRRFDLETLVCRFQERPECTATLLVSLGLAQAVVHMVVINWALILCLLRYW